MGNSPTKNERVNLSSDQIKSNIKNVFKLNENKMNDYYTDTIGWKTQSGGRNYVTIKRYKQYKHQTQFGGNLYDQKPNAINVESEFLSELSSADISKFGNMNNLYNNVGGGINSEITEINKLKEIISGSLEQKKTKQEEMGIKHRASNYRELSSDMSEIENLKNLIKQQIGGGCGCSQSMSQHINLSALKGGAINEKKEKKKESESHDSTNKDKTEDEDIEEIDEDELDEDEIDEDELDEDEIDEDELDEDEFDEEDSNMKRMTSEESSDVNSNIINAKPFYSSESVSAGSYFRNINRNKF